MRNATFSGLAVDTNHFLIRATYVGGINRQISHVPSRIVIALRQTLVYRVLVTARECGENELASIGVARMNG